MTTNGPSTSRADGAPRIAPMTPHAIAVALFAAFVVGGILAKAVPLWLVAVVGLAIGAITFFMMNRYPYFGRRGAGQR